MRGVVPCEVPASWLAAGGAAPRRWRRARTRWPPAAAAASTPIPTPAARMYCPIERQAAASDAAVAATQRQVVMYNGQRGGHLFLVQLGRPHLVARRRRGAAPTSPTCRRSTTATTAPAASTRITPGRLRRYTPGALGQAPRPAARWDRSTTTSTGRRSGCCGWSPTARSGDDSYRAPPCSRDGPSLHLLPAAAGDAVAPSTRSPPATGCSSAAGCGRSRRRRFTWSEDRVDGSWQQTQNGVSLGAEGASPPPARRSWTWPTGSSETAPSRRSCTCTWGRAMTLASQGRLPRHDVPASAGRHRHAAEARAPVTGRRWDRRWSAQGRLPLLVRGAVAAAGGRDSPATPTTAVDLAGAGGGVGRWQAS